MDEGEGRKRKRYADLSEDEKKAHLIDVRNKLRVYLHKHGPPVRKDGAGKSQDISALPQKTASTERRNWTPSFQSYDDFIQKTLQSLDGFMIVMSTDRMIVSVSHSITSLLGYLPNDIVGKSFLSLLPDNEKKEVFPKMAFKIPVSSSVGKHIDFCCHFKRGDAESNNTSAYEYVKVILTLKDISNEPPLLFHSVFSRYGCGASEINIPLDDNFYLVGTICILRAQTLQDFFHINESSEAVPLVPNSNEDKPSEDCRSSQEGRRYSGMESTETGIVGAESLHLLPHITSYIKRHEEEMMKKFQEQLNESTQILQAEIQSQRSSLETLKEQLQEMHNSKPQVLPSISGHVHSPDLLEPGPKKPHSEAIKSPFSDISEAASVSGSCLPYSSQFPENLQQTVDASTQVPIQEDMKCKLQPLLLPEPQQQQLPEPQQQQQQQLPEPQQQQQQQLPELQQQQQQQLPELQQQQQQQLPEPQQQQQLPEQPQQYNITRENQALCVFQPNQPSFSTFCYNNGFMARPLPQRPPPPRSPPPPLISAPPPPPQPQPPASQPPLIFLPIKMTAEQPSSYYRAENVNASGYYRAKNVNASGYYRAENVNASGYYRAENLNASGYYRAENLNSSGYYHAENLDASGYYRLTNFNGRENGRLRFFPENQYQSRMNPYSMTHRSRSHTAYSTNVPQTTTISNPQLAAVETPQDYIRLCQQLQNPQSHRYQIVQPSNWAPNEQATLGQTTYAQVVPTGQVLYSSRPVTIQAPGNNEPNQLNSILPQQPHLNP